MNNFENAKEVTDKIFTEEEMEERFSSHRTEKLAFELVEQAGIASALDGRSFAVIAVAGNDERSDVGRSVEMLTFRKRFGRSLSELEYDYRPYDESSTFLCLIDIREKNNPKPAGVLRSIAYKDGVGLKSINDFTSDSSDNPWLEEIISMYFGDDSIYDQNLAWDRLCQSIGYYIDPRTTHDIATIAVHEEYGSNGALDGPSIGLYHSSLRYSVQQEATGYMTIQEERPLQIIQNFGEPFKTFPGISPHPFDGGDNNTVPTYAIFETGFAEIRRRSELIGSVLIDGFGLEKDFILLQEQNPEKFSNETLGLPTYR